jgi:nucleotidyltransferase substrate binding protein (TIGR01987 family)
VTVTSRPDSTPDRRLDLGSLRAATQALANAVDVVSSPEFAAADPRWRDTLVAGLVQHFEFTFELCWKMLKRQLEREVPSPSELDGLSYRELIRLGHQRGLIQAVEPWFEFRELRNITAHTYARDKALKVASGAPALLMQARALLGTIESRNHG